MTSYRPPTACLHITDDHGTNLADIGVQVPLVVPEHGYLPIFDAARFKQQVKQAASAFVKVFESADPVSASGKCGWDVIRPSRILGNRHLWFCREINEGNPIDIGFVFKVADSYDPPLYFAPGSTVYADSDSLYGQVFQYDHDGRIKIRCKEPVTKFMRVPIPEEMKETPCSQ